METTGTGTGAFGGSVKGKVCYEAHLPALFLWYGLNFAHRSGRGSPIHGPGLCFSRTGTCAGCAGRTASVKSHTFPIPQMWRQP